MAMIGHSNLWHGGAACDPMPKRREDFFNPEKKTGPPMSGFGSKPTWNFIPEWDKFQYPADDVPKEGRGPTTLECAKGGGYYPLSRNIAISDPKRGARRFRTAEDSNNTEMWRWFLTHIDKLVTDYCLNFVFIPKCIESDCIFLRTCVPMPGLTFQVVEFYTDTPIGPVIDFGAPVQAAVDNCHEYCLRMMIPDELQFSNECNRVFGIKLIDVPKINDGDVCPEGGDIAKAQTCGSLQGLSMDFSVRAFCPWAGD